MEKEGGEREKARKKEVPVEAGRYGEVESWNKNSCKKERGEKERSKEGGKLEEI